MDISEIKSKSKKFLEVNNYGPIVLYAVILVVCAMFAVITSIIIWFALAYLLFFFLYAPVVYAQSSYYLRSYNLRTEGKFKMFEGYAPENFFRSVTVRLIRTGLGILLCLLFVVPGVVYLTRTTMAYYLLVNFPEMSATDALKHSNELMKGKTWGYVGLSLSYAVWFFLGIITVGLVWIYWVPHFNVSKSIYFQNEVMGADDDVVVTRDDIVAILDAKGSKDIVKKYYKDDDVHMNGVPSRGAIASNGKQSNGQFSNPQFSGAQYSNGKYSNGQYSNGQFSYGSPVMSQPAMHTQPIMREHMQELVKTAQREVVIPNFGYNDILSKEFEIRDHETFEEYRVRVGHIRKERSKNQPYAKTTEQELNVLKTKYNEEMIERAKVMEEARIKAMQSEADALNGIFDGVDLRNAIGLDIEDIEKDIASKKTIDTRVNTISVTPTTRSNNSVDIESIMRNAEEAEERMELERQEAEKLEREEAEILEKLKEEKIREQVRAGRKLASDRVASSERASTPKPEPKPEPIVKPRASSNPSTRRQIPVTISPSQELTAIPATKTIQRELTVDDRRKAVADKLAKMKANTIDEIPTTTSRESNDSRAYNIKSKERLKTESGEPTREEIIEKIRNERKK